MNKKFLTLLAVITLMPGLAPVFAQKPAEGTLMVQDKNYPLSHALAYETTINDEEVIAVVLSGQAISSEKLAAAKEAEKEGNEGDFKRPFLKLEFKKTGEFKVWSAGAGNTSLGRRGGKATGELKAQDGRVSGKANQPDDKDGMFSSGFDVRFEVALLKAGESLPATAIKKPGPAANVPPTVTGKFIGNGKDAKLAFVSAHWREPFSDQASIKLVFTEKDHSKDKKPDFNAAFGKFGSALLISLHEDGGIFGCQVVHTAHEKQGFTAIGQIKANNFSYADGKVEGELTTDGEDDVFGEKWEVKDLKFVVPLGEIPAEFQPAAEKKKITADAPVTKLPPLPAAARAGEKSASPPADQLKVKELALTKDASDFEYKTLVEHVVFKSKSNVKAVCTELTANLKAQGWTMDGRDLVNPQSSILKRKRGEASLTIFVKPEGAGSEVKMFTQGLSWDGQ